MGRPSADIIGLSVEELLGAQQFEKIRSKLEAAVAGEKITYEETFSFDGQELVTKVNYVPDRDSDGQVRGFYALVVDITEQKNIQQALAKNQQRQSACLDIPPKQW